MHVYSKLAEPERLSESQVLASVYKWVRKLCAVELAMVPIMYTMGCYKQGKVANYIIEGLYVVITGFKLTVLIKFKQSDDENTQHALQKGLWDPEQIPFTECKLFWPKWVTLVITTIPSYCETLTVALAVGLSGAEWTPAQQDIWSTSWQKTPFGLLSFVGWMTLPSVLTMVVSIGFLGHIVTFVGVCYCSLWHIEADWGEINVLATNGGLLMITAVVKARFPGFEEESGMAEYARVAVKLILGSVLRLYLKVSLLAILMTTANEANEDAIATARTAVLLGFFHAVQIIYNCKNLTSYAVREVWIGGNRFSRCIHAIGIALVLVPLIISLIRFVGTYTCGSHIFNVSVWSCLPVNNASAHQTVTV